MSVSNLRMITDSGELTVDPVADVCRKKPAVQNAYRRFMTNNFGSVISSIA
jgi:hypothetical protein